MAVDLAAARCSNHPERPGAALCMSCRAVACHECATRYDGIHYCARCLARRVRGRATLGDAAAWVAWLVVAAGLLALVPWAIAATGSIVASWLPARG